MTFEDSNYRVQQLPKSQLGLLGLIEVLESTSLLNALSAFHLITKV